MRDHAPPRLEVLGTPLHPMLSDLPASFTTTAPLFDLAARAVRAPGLDAAGYWVGLAGVASALPAALAGLADYRRVDASHPARSRATLHGLLNGAALVTAGTSLWLRRRDPRNPPRASLALALAASGLTAVSGHLGGELVFQHGFRVDAPEPERLAGP
jgi:uncharacterized membrane protein